jgi:hypothetical protein
VKQIILSILLMCGLNSVAQECNDITVYGSVRDSVERRAFYNLVLINKTTGKGVFGRPDGSFTLSANNGDSVILSITGYKSVGFRVKGNESCSQHIEKTIVALSYESADVVVRPLKTLEQLKEERERLAFKETRTLSGIQAAGSPITFLYERFSKLERSKRLVAEMTYQDNKVLVLKELIRVYVSYDVVDLDEDEFVDFIQFLAVSDGFLKTASDYDLILFIKDKFEHFRSLQQKEVVPGVIYKE